VVVSLVASAMMASVLIADIGGYLAARLQAAAAADAAALAAAPMTFSAFGTSDTPAMAAGSVATANGATLVECRCPIDRSWGIRRVDVVVSRDVDLGLFGRMEVRAASAAEFDPTALIEP